MPKFADLAKQSLAVWALWACILALAWLAYSPGLSGGFLFDDFINLPALGATGPVDDIETFWRYITSGTADPTGRPIALLSFLIDARDWPADPGPFLRTNLILHLVNGSLLFLLLRHLDRALAPNNTSQPWAALLAAGLWLLHPLFVSTTLYIVQREAMLPASFILGGLLAYGHGRLKFAQTQGERGLAWMLAGLVLGTLLGILSKANGILLPVLAWVLEATIYRSLPMPGAVGRRRLNQFKSIFLYLPTFLVLGYLGSFLLRWNSVARVWTIGQRVLSQPRILVDYLELLLVPRSVSTGLYNDNYIASADLWHPASTLPAILLVVALVAGALYWRRQAPTLCAAILFFFAGHLLESTSVPLELYFEHRNYLPAALLFWPLARLICGWRRSLFLRSALAVALIVLLALTTHQRADIWGKPGQLAALWALHNPDSSRAQATAAIEEVSSGRADLAVQRLAPLWQQRPKDLQIALNYVNAACAAGGLSASDLAQLAETLRTADIGTLLVRQWLEKAIGMAQSGDCPGLDMDSVQALLAAARENPAINTPVAQQKSMPPLLAMLALEQRDPNAALRYFNQALAANISPETAGGQAATLASSEYYEQALQHLDYYETIKQQAPRPRMTMAYLHQQVLDRQQYWPKELALLRAKLHAEIAAEGSSP